MKKERSEETKRRESQLLMSVPGFSAEIAQFRINRVRLQIEKGEKILRQTYQLWSGL